MGNANGVFGVGLCYQYGFGVEKDDHKAFIYYQKSAEMGHFVGAYKLGNYYKYGIGIEKDEIKAFIYHRKSAEMGYIDGMSSVAECYRCGISVIRDLDKAKYWYQRSRENYLTLVKNEWINNLEIEDDLKKKFIESKYQLSWISFDEFKNIKMTDL
ncbi:hypothetical protein C2G38_914018 [Gigaspora rosea]|uniref:Uncharacterized protein n=1 Tax=Gigaspora rosea TaxID=44941 RepID=A0A397U4Y7_9GLOM|nr:hypothetical protein C2G38_914018 [Gigaspora rosea]